MKIELLPPTPAAVRRIEAMAKAHRAEQKAAAQRKKKPEPVFKVQVEHAITYKNVACLLCNALEGGSDYWGHFVSTKKPKALIYQHDPNQLYGHLDYPLNPGGEVLFTEEDTNKTHTLDLTAIKRGLALFPVKCPSQFADWLAENDDAETGDCFLQLCLFGEVIYG